MANIVGPSKKILYNETCLPGSLFLSSEVYPTSTLEYINSQLVAHGFACSPGLSLDGLANDDSERVVKCLLAMLSQRIVSHVLSLFLIARPEVIRRRI